MPVHQISVAPLASEESIPSSLQVSKDESPVENSFKITSPLSRSLTGSVPLISDKVSLSGGVTLLSPKRSMSEGVNNISDKINDVVVETDEVKDGSLDSKFIDSDKLYEQASTETWYTPPTGMSRESSCNPSHCSSHAQSMVSLASSQGDICRICHCGSEEDSQLIMPCICTGSLKFVHQHCLHQWIKGSNAKDCELCHYAYRMYSKLKPVGKWESLEMSANEKRKILCSVAFHFIAITCVVWSLYVLIERTTDEIEKGNLEWPFWTKLVVVAIGFTGGVVFMYIQCKVYLQLWKRLKAYNRVIYVQDCPMEDRLRYKLNYANETAVNIDSQVLS